jgi:hypothetical protein
VVRNLAPVELGLPWFGDIALAECKDLKDRVPTSEVDRFFAKLVLTSTKTGLLASKRGITGAHSGRHGSGAQEHAFSRSDVAILDLQLRDLQRLESADAFRGLLQSLYEDVRLGRA